MERNLSWIVRRNSAASEGNAPTRRVDPDHVEPLQYSIAKQAVFPGEDSFPKHERVDFFEFVFTDFHFGFSAGIPDCKKWTTNVRACGRGPAEALCAAGIDSDHCKLDAVCCYGNAKGTVISFEFKYGRSICGKRCGFQI